MCVNDNLLDFEEKIDQSTRILVVNPLNTLWSYQQTIEVALRAIHRKSHVEYLNVGYSMPSRYEVNSKQHLSLFKNRYMPNSVDRILKKFGAVSVKPSFNIKFLFDTPKFDSIRDLKKYTYDEHPIGAMVYSAIASTLESTSFELHEVSDHVKLYFAIAQNSYLQISKSLKNSSFNFIFTTNDRLIGSAMALSFAKKKSIEFRVFYYGNNPNFINEHKSSLYDYSNWKKDIALFWDTHPPDKQELSKIESAIAELKYQPSSNSYPFLKLQTSGQGIEKRKKTVVFYATSEHEHSPNYEIVQNLNGFPNQYTAFAELYAICNKLGYDLILKYHPKRNGEVAKSSEVFERLDWLNIVKGMRITEIMANSNIDTYKLMSQADFNVVWSSTVGIECIIRQFPVIVIGDIHWLSTSWGIHAWDTVKLEHLMTHGVNLLPNSALFLWFNFKRNFGNCYKYVQSEQGKLLFERKFYPEFRIIIRILKWIKIFLKGFISLGE